MAEVGERDRSNRTNKTNERRHVGARGTADDTASLLRQGDEGQAVRRDYNCGSLHKFAISPLDIVFR